MDFKFILIKLLEKSEITSDTLCWLWKSSKTNGGYGRTSFNGKNESLHRISAHIFFNLDLNNRHIQANHKCKNRHCWNPNHLYIGTQSDNIMDAVFSKTLGSLNKNNLCQKGHELTPKNTYTYCGRRSCRICRKLSKSIYQKKYRSKNK
jgi:hypothetical protein